MLRQGLAVVFAALLPGGAVAANSAGGSPCLAAIAGAEHASHLPPRLLGAIGLVESGRFDPARKTFVPWPWTVNAGGVGYFYESEPQAVAAVEAFRLSGVQSIDVGCMQINLQDHPSAFTSLDEAFDPAANAAYAARFLVSLFHQSGSWPQAAAAYHSRTPAIAAPYQERVMAVWPLASRYGGWSGRASPGRAIPLVDPYRVATPEFVSRLLADAKWRDARNARIVAGGLESEHVKPGHHSRAPRR